MAHNIEDSTAEELRQLHDLARNLGETLGLHAPSNTKSNARDYLADITTLLSTKMAEINDLRSSSEPTNKPSL